MIFFAQRDRDPWVNSSTLITSPNLTPLYRHLRQYQGCRPMVGRNRAQGHLRDGERWLELPQA